MITVDFIWDEGDHSVGLWPGWEACYATIEQDEGIRTVISFEPVRDVPVHQWRIDQIETHYYWSEPCSYCGGTGNRPFAGGPREGQPMGCCHPCKDTGVVEKLTVLTINEYEGETALMKRRLSEIPPVAVIVAREWERITLRDEIRVLEENSSLVAEHADWLISRVENDDDASQEEVDKARQEAIAINDQYQEARKRYESIYGELETE